MFRLVYQPRRRDLAQAEIHGFFLAQSARYKGGILSLRALQRSYSHQYSLIVILPILLNMSHLQSLHSPTTYAVLAAVLILGYAAYRAALPRPIPGIPYHEKSAKSVLGDVPRMLRHKQKFGTVYDWTTSQGAEFKSPIYQLFLNPFTKPAVFVTDPREAHDVLLRRAKEFDRSQFLIGRLCILSSCLVCLTVCLARARC